VTITTEPGPGLEPPYLPPDGIPGGRVGPEFGQRLPGIFPGLLVSVVGGSPGHTEGGLWGNPLRFPETVSAGGRSLQKLRSSLGKAKPSRRLRPVQIP
jgi:hypothetical protein